MILQKNIHEKGVRHEAMMMMMMMMMMMIGNNRNNFFIQDWYA